MCAVMAVEPAFWPWAVGLPGTGQARPRMPTASPKIRSHGRSPGKSPVAGPGRAERQPRRLARVRRSALQIRRGAHRADPIDWPHGHRAARAIESGTPAWHVLGAAVAPSRQAATGSRCPPDHSRPPPVHRHSARDRAAAHPCVDLAGIRARQPRHGLVGRRARCRVVPHSWRQFHRQLGGKPVVLPPSAARRRHAAEVRDPRAGYRRAADWPRRRCDCSPFCPGAPDLAGG